MRTNIDLNEDLLAAARRYSTASTKRALVEEALRTYVEVKENERRRASYTDRLASLRRRTSELKLRSRPLDIIRSDRDR